MRRPLAYEPKHALNAICPYFTMFPLEYPLRVLRKHRSASPVVMDPCCGRGTTLYAARALGLRSRGIDSSGVAVAIARAKLCRVDVHGALHLAMRYIANSRVGRIPESEFFQRAFDAKVLRDICAIRQGLLEEQRDSDAVVLLRAAMLGCLHGPRSKSLAEQAYFSNQMPRTFASKPRYSVRYWRSKRLRPPSIDVTNVLRRKLSRISSREMAPEGGLTDARLGDARFAASLPTHARDFSVVVTSPPYYGMRTYVEDQWLRNWILGGPDHLVYGQGAQLKHTGKEVFAASLGAIWRNMARTNASDLDMYIRLGTIPSAKVDAKSIFHESLEASGVRWEVVSTRDASTASRGKRQAEQMAAESAAATEYDFHVVRA